MSVHQEVGLSSPAGKGTVPIFAPDGSTKSPVSQDENGDCPPDSLNLYRFPALYDALKAPDAEDLTAVRSLLRRFVGEPQWSMLDPACGPGNWLRPFKGEARLLAGNDNCQQMVDYTRATTGATVTLGDMFEIKSDHSFDVVLEASGVSSLLPDIETVARWVLSFRDLLARRGVVLLLINFRSPVPTKLPATLWQTPWLEVQGGQARIQYELLRDSKELGSQHIRRTVETQGGSWPRKIVESYDLRVWNPGHLETLRKIPGYNLEACVDAASPANLNARPIGERLLVFRPV